MKFKNETAEKLLVHHSGSLENKMREFIWVKPGAEVDIHTDSADFGETMGLTHIPSVVEKVKAKVSKKKEEEPKEEDPKEPVESEEGAVGETKVETKQKKKK